MGLHFDGRLPALPLACKYQTRVEVNGCGKASLLWHGNNYDRKTFYSKMACTIKLFIIVIFAVLKYAKAFATTIHFHPSLILAGKARSLPKWIPSWDYNNTAKFTTVKSFIVYAKVDFRYYWLVVSKVTPLKLGHVSNPLPLKPVQQTLLSVKLQAFFTS